MNKGVSISYIFLISTLLYALYILIVSTSPTAPGAETGKEVTPYFSYIAHYVLYFGFSYFIFVTYNLSKRYLVNPYLATILSASIYGLFVEVIQYYLPHRHFSFLDIGINILGAVSLVAFMFTLQKNTKNKIIGLFF
ncbi:MAG: VanZ family protein [Thermoplasmatota archaeon]